VANKDGVPSFCIAKFEMKHPTDATGKNHTHRDNNAVPVSQPQNKPWTEITRDKARAACERVTLPGFTVALISNGEWQAVARNIESTAANWSGGKVGEGAIPRGSSDGIPNDGLPVTSEVDPYDGTGNSASSGWEQKRIHQLSTGDVVWDLAGNVSEWVFENWQSLCGCVDELDLRTQSLNTLSERNRSLYGPFGNYGRAENMGYFEVASGYYRTPFWVLRGGGNYSSIDSGLFNTYVGANDFNVTEDAGFRCAARPSR
jgi:hypothetical protein